MITGPPVMYVDVQLATPYGVTGHLLIPAARLGKPGAPDAGQSSSGGGQASSDSGADPLASALPGWGTTDLTLAYVYKGAGIVRGMTRLTSPRVDDKPGPELRP